MNREHPLKKVYKIIDCPNREDKINNIPEFPRIIELEITNVCNFQCSMCKTGNGTAKRPKGFMDLGTFKKVLAEVKGRTTALKFVGQGESTLHPQFYEIVELAKKQGVICHLTTNGSKLDRTAMQKLVNIQIDSIKFSFQGVDEEGYFTLRGKRDFCELIDKIKMLKELRGTNEYPFITIGTSVTNESEEDIKRFRMMAEKIADKVEVGTTTLEFLNENMIENPDEKEKLIQLKKRQTLCKKRYSICNQVFDVLTVRWDGSVSACCADNDGVMVCGNLKTDSLIDVWNGSKLAHYRDILSRNEFDKLPLCKDCYDYMGYMNSDNKRD